MMMMMMILYNYNTVRGAKNMKLTQ